MEEIKVLITVESGIVQAVNASAEIKVIVLDFDSDGLGSKDEQKLVDIDGEPIEAYIYTTEVNKDIETVDHYFKQAGVVQTDQDKYLKNPSHCPFCDSDNITGNRVDIDNRTATQQIFCEDCGKSWHDTYELTGYIEA